MIEEKLRKYIRKESEMESSESFKKQMEED